jgi:thiamine-phosphate pyrophosphorylase
LHALSDCRLYAILDLAYAKAADAGEVVAKMLEGGVDLIQLRAKGNSFEAIVDLAAGLHPVTSQASTPLLVNDHAAVAGKVQVEGVHVGQDDDPIAVVREKAGRAIIVGKSTHSVEQAMAAQEEGADYIGFGPIFATPTKPDYAPIGLGDIKRVHAEVSLPIFCIGGINIDNLQQVIDAGAKRVVMVSALLRAHNIVDYARCATDMLA